MPCPGLHCASCAGGGLGVAVVWLLAAGVALHTIWHTIVEVVRVVVLTVEILALVVAGAAGVALVGLVVVGVLRIRGRVLAARAQRAVPAVQVIQLRAPQGVTSTPAAAIEAPRTTATAWPLPGDWQHITLSNDRSTSS